MNDSEEPGADTDPIEAMRERRTHPAAAAIPPAPAVPRIHEEPVVTAVRNAVRDELREFEHARLGELKSLSRRVDGISATMDTIMDPEAGVPHLVRSVESALRDSVGEFRGILNEIRDHSLAMHETARQLTVRFTRVEADVAELMEWKQGIDRALEQLKARQ